MEKCMWHCACTHLKKIQGLNLYDIGVGMRGRIIGPITHFKEGRTRRIQTKIIT